MIAKVYVKEKSLGFQVPGQPEYELVPLRSHHFNINDLPGYSIEFKATDTSATAFTFFKPDGTLFKVKEINSKQTPHLFGLYCYSPTMKNGFCER